MNLDVKGVFNGIWCEKYRPHTLNDIILDDRTLDIIKGFKSEIPNLLFVGNPGTGKCLDGEEELLLYVDDYEYEKIMMYLHTPVAPEIK